MLPTQVHIALSASHVYIALCPLVNEVVAAEQICHMYMFMMLPTQFTLPQAHSVIAQL